MVTTTLTPDTLFLVNTMPEVDRIASEIQSSRATVIRSALTTYFGYTSKTVNKRWLGSCDKEERQWEATHKSIKVNLDDQLKDVLDTCAKQCGVKTNQALKLIVSKQLGCQWGGLR